MAESTAPTPTPAPPPRTTRGHRASRIPADWRLRSSSLCLPYEFGLTNLTGRVPLHSASAPDRRGVLRRAHGSRVQDERMGDALATISIAAIVPETIAAGDRFLVVRRHGRHMHRGSSPCCSSYR